MKNKKTKLLYSVLSLLLCLSMLLGSTFAWFTDSVHSGINVIAAGNLDVALYHSNAAVQDEKVDETTELFMDLNGKDILWEPGVVSYENLRVANEGDLALAYQMAINTANENFVLDPSGNRYGLSQVLKVGLVEGGITATDRAGVVASVEAGSWLTLSSFRVNGSLLPAGAGESEKTWGIVIYWEPSDIDNLWNLNNGKQLDQGEVLSIDLGIQLLATQEVYESDAFGSDYDASAKQDSFPDFVGGSASATVVPNGQNQINAGVMMSAGKVTATVPAGAQVVPGTNQLTLTVTEMGASGANIQLSENEKMRSLDVHIDGIAAENTTPITVELKEVAPIGLNMGNYKLYHVEADGTKEMTLVAAAEDFTAHNQFKYDPATGDIVLYMATFSEVAIQADMTHPWKGGFDYSWYTGAVALADGEATTEYIIANADQLAAFGAIVGGMDGQTQNSFAGKTVKLIADINLNDAEENNTDKIFYPIGYNSSDGKYEKTGVAVTTGFYNFCGTFDGNGHTISNFYQNTWEMKGDNNYYDATLQYYRDGMGLFGRVYGGTVKNLTINNFKSDGEYTTTGCVAAYADGATFENIAIFDCNPRVYNIGNGGIVGCVGWYAKEANLKTTFTNITVDNSNKISALWGSYDVACGGIVGQYYPTSGQTSANKPANGGIDLINCHVAAQMDVYNDVCGNYQYYAYRYTGMIIGSIRENTTTVIDGVTKTIPDMTGISATGCTVNYGDWNDYYYCEFEKNGHPSYSGPDDYKFSRVDKSEIVFDENGKAIGCTHNHSSVEDNRAIYLPFHQLFTGYGWGVSSIGLEQYSGIVTNLDITEGDQEASVEKFAVVDTLPKVVAGKTYTVDQFFKAEEDLDVEIDADNVHVFVSPKGSTQMVYVEYEPNTEDWTKGTLKFIGQGDAKILITDYYFCKEQSATVTVNGSGTLYRVGNAGQDGDTTYDVTYKDIARVLTRSEAYSSIELTTELARTVNGEKIDFTATGIVGVKINGIQYYLEVVDAKNVTSLPNTISSNIVLIKDCGLSSLTISGRNSVYGNGFTATYTGNGQYLNSGIKQGVVTVKDNGVIDNLRIVASVYPSAYLYYSEAQAGPKDVEGTKIRYHYQLSAVGAFGNAKIQNCYIYGGRTNIYIGDGNVEVQNSVLECGTLANVQIISTDAYTVTFKDVTTIQHKMNATVGDTAKSMHGAGILVGDGDRDNEDATAPTIVLDGEFKQYNWVTENDKKAVSDSNAQMIIGGALNATAFNHTVNGVNASNLGIIFLNDFEKISVTNNTKLPYEEGAVSLNLMGANVTRTVYSLQGATNEQIFSNPENADRETSNGYYAPQFKYSADLGGQYEAEGGDQHCYREGDTIYVMFPSGDTKELNLTALVNIQKYTDQNLNLVITCKDESGNAVAVTDGKVKLSDAGKYTVTYTVTDELFYGENGAEVENADKVEYSWNVTVDVSLKDTAIPDARFEFDATKQKMGYYVKSSIFSKSVYQYVPFLAGLKIYDYIGQTEYLRFDGDNDFNKVASIAVTNKYSGNDARILVTLTDGGVIDLQLLARADSSGGSTYTGSIKTSGNTIYFVNDGTTSESDKTTTSAYWYVDYYKFTGNNGVTIQSGQQTFNSTGSSVSTPSGSFSTSIKYTVTYDANGGNCGQNTGYATSAATAVTLPTPTKSGYIFAGWYTAANGGTRVGGAGDSYTPSANITLYAQWGKPCTVTYNANGGSCGTASEKYSGTALTLPTPTRDGYWFVGWYDAAEGGNKVGDAGAKYNPSGETTLYAHWQEKVEYTVTYNANGGTCGTASATYQGTALTLPTPTKTGYTFNGWYTAASGGTKIGDAGASYTPSANITLYAQWKISSYTITVTTNNATVKVNGTTVNNNGTVSVQYGAQVTVEVTYSQDNDRSTTIKGADGTTYTSPFTMPAQKVTINATSSSPGCVTPDTLVTLADGTQKRIDQVTYTDQLLVWDFYKGEYAAVPAAIIFDHGYDNNTVIKLNFSDGTSVKMVNLHQFFDADLNKLVSIDAESVANYVGHKFVKRDGDGYKTVALVDYTITEEYCEAWGIISAEHYNILVEDMFSADFMKEDYALFNYFEVGQNMKYNKMKMMFDIAKYGLYTYEDFAEYLTPEQFAAFNVKYFKIAVGKGEYTYEGILNLIATYLEN